MIPPLRNKGKYILLKGEWEIMKVRNCVCSVLYVFVRAEKVSEEQQKRCGGSTNAYEDIS